MRVSEAKGSSCRLFSCMREVASAAFERSQRQSQSSPGYGFGRFVLSDIRLEFTLTGEHYNLIIVVVSEDDSEWKGKNCCSPKVASLGEVDLRKSIGPPYAVWPGVPFHYDVLKLSQTAGWVTRYFDSRQVARQANFPENLKRARQLRQDRCLSEPALSHTFRFSRCLSP